MGVVTNLKKDLDQSALQLMIECRDRLYAVAFRECGNVADADDLVSRTLVKAIQKLDGEVEIENLFGWMKTMMLHLRTDDQRKAVVRGTHPVDPDDLAAQAEADCSTDEQILKDSDGEVIRQALDELDPKYKQAMLMRYYDDFSLKEIADILRLPMGTVSRRIQIAHRLLAGKLSGKLGKKPVVVLLAVLLGVGSLLGAWKAAETSWPETFAHLSETVRVEGLVTAASSSAAGNEGAAGAPCGLHKAAAEDLTKSEKEQGVNAMTIRSGTAALLAAAMSLNGSAKVPVGYRFLEYVETTAAGQQYVDTAYTPLTGTCGLYVDLQLLTVDSGDKVAYGVVSPNRCLATGGNKWGYGWMDSGTGTDGNLGTADTDRHVFEQNFLNSGVFIMDGDPAKCATLRQVTVATERSAYVGAGHYNWVYGARPMRIFRVKISSDSSTIVCDMLPALDGNGVPCLYDAIRGTTHYSGSLTPFVAGPPIDGIYVAGHPSSVGSPSPGYGLFADVAKGEVCDFTCPAVYTNSAKTVSAACTGWELVHTNGTVTSGPELKTSIEYGDATAGALLIWQWTLRYKVTSVPEVTVSSDWVVSGDFVTLTATPPAGKAVHHWVDSATARVFTGNPLKMVVSAPMDLQPVYGNARHAAPGATGSGEDVEHPGDLETLVASADTGDVVLLAAGEYPTTSLLTIGKGFSVRGAGMDKSIIRPAAMTRAIKLDHADARLSDLTVSGAKGGGWQYTGSAVYITQNGGRLTDVRVTDSVQSSNIGGGVVTIEGPGGMSRCRIDGNTIDDTSHTDGQGGIVRISGAATAENCLIENCLIEGNNSKGNGGGLLIYSGATVRSCTLVNNRAGWKGGGVYIASNTPRIYDSVVAFNTADGDTDSFAPNVWIGSDSFAASCLRRCAFSGVGCGTEPLVVEKSDLDEDLTPSAGSRLIDSGDDSLSVSDLDFGHGPRIMGSAIDIGCYEQSADRPMASFTCSTNLLMKGSSVTLAPVVSGVDLETAAFTWTISNRVTSAVTVRKDKTAFSFKPDAGRFDVELAVAVGGVVSCRRAIPNCFFVGVQTVYVVPAPNPSALYPYDSWETAQTNIQTAIDSAVDGATIVLAKGEFPVSATISLSVPVTLQGAGIDKTVLRSSNGTRLLSVNDPDATVSGMTLTDASYGSWQVAGAALLVGGKGGTLSCVRVTNSTHPSNISGGVAVFNGPAHVVCCVFDHNTLSDSSHTENQGGIVLVTAAATFDSCLICDNWSKGNGGGLMLTAAATVRNCTIVNNRAGWLGGGLYVTDAGARVYNTVVAFNASDNDDSTYAPDIKFGFDSWANGCLGHCAFSGVQCGTAPKCVSVDDFRRPASGDWRLRRQSSCVNAGDFTVFCAPKESVMAMEDFAGAPRLRGETVDIGCYEYAEFGFLLLVK